METEIIRPQRGALITAVVGTLSAILLGSVLLGDGWREAAAVAPWLVLVTGASWATFVQPRIEVSYGGIRLVNVLRTIDIHWPAVTAIETRYMLTIVTRYGEFTAWSAPAGGRRTAARARRRGGHGAVLDTVDTEALAGTSAGEPTIGPGDLPDSASGAAALTIRRRWSELRRAGHLDDPRLEHDRATVTWHWPQIATAVALVAAGVSLR